MRSGSEERGLSTQLRYKRAAAWRSTGTTVDLWEQKWALPAPDSRRVSGEMTAHKTAHTTSRPRWTAKFITVSPYMSTSSYRGRLAGVWWQAIVKRSSSSLTNI